MAQSRSGPNRRYTSEAANVATGSDMPVAGFDGKLLACEDAGGFFDLSGAFGSAEDFRMHDPERTRYMPVGRAPGVTRGMAFADDHVSVGSSEVIKRYEPCAPGFDPDETRCGVWVFDWRRGETVATLSWLKGYQIYDVQVLPGIENPRSPLASRASDGINPYLRFSV